MFKASALTDFKKAFVWDFVWFHWRQSITSTLSGLLVTPPEMLFHYRVDSTLNHYLLFTLSKTVLYLLRS